MLACKYRYILQGFQVLRNYAVKPANICNKQHARPGFEPGPSESSVRFFQRPYLATGDRTYLTATFLPLSMSSLADISTVSSRAC